MRFSRCPHASLMQVIVFVTSIATTGELTAQEKTTVPDETAEQAAKKTAGEIYGGRFALAKTASDKTALAAEMIKAAVKMQNGSADQFVLLRISRNIAVGAGDATTALSAVKELVQRFDVPALTLPAETLLGAAEQATANAQHKAAAESAGPIIAKLAEADEYELAIRVCEAARAAAQGAREFKLAAELANQLPELKRLGQEFQAYRDARAVMEADPAEPAANLAAGRYLCFVKGDWERGVPYLALGSDPALNSVALMELRGAESAEAQAAIGDAWWDAAEGKEGAERDTLRLRAGLWYRQAVPKLAGGLVGLKATQRLEEISKIGREMPAASGRPATSRTPPLAIAPFNEKTAKRHQEAWATYLKVPLEISNSIGMRFVLIPPGEFDMGSTEADLARFLEQAKAKTKQPKWYIDHLRTEAPKHRVRITKPFYLGRCEVTQTEYERLIGSNPSKFKGDPTRPVEMVDWDEASAFCRRLAELPQEQASRTQYRLPTEAEWEYACRAGTTTTWYSGDTEAALKTVAWFNANAEAITHPVRQKTPNGWGLYDMHGNVCEWCQDWWGDGYYATSPMDDPTGPAVGSRRVNRGGSYANIAPVCRASFRNSNEPKYRRDQLGFRLARTVAVPSPAP